MTGAVGILFFGGSRRAGDEDQITFKKTPEKPNKMDIRGGCA
jgi:hypothetical protein